MGTKNSPGKFDCYDNAEPDEPMFVLLARDVIAPEIVERWAYARRVLIRHGHKPQSDAPMVDEAMQCAKAMRAWRTKNRPLARVPSCELPGGNCKHFIKCDMIDGCWLKEHPEDEDA
jgi:hypothetical protein